MKLIDADAKTFPKPYEPIIKDTEYAKDWNSCLNSISQQPTIDAEPVRYGHWIIAEFDCVKCSVCGCYEDVWWANQGTNYCPNCGAKMIEVSE